ncbi:hypothetical protein BZA05DRAFT_421688 [Tricharina praecox]|uniref:uncharacterized protein n=1 Tax=Tricharina praecox TaxID=43433 RepID=UPI0022203C86|nr:uncharacterized protein BZA05DRAFT_421688 [Tricharina praecox]KAI5844755.1 hypothetical protein BZA05DRAFT_421688 [Tricharina praecox]
MSSRANQSTRTRDARPRKPEPTTRETHSKRLRGISDTTHKRAYCRYCIRKVIRDFDTDPEARRLFDPRGTIKGSSEWTYCQAIDAVPATCSRVRSMRTHVTVCPYIPADERARVLKKSSAAHEVDSSPDEPPCEQQRNLYETSHGHYNGHGEASSNSSSSSSSSPAPWSQHVYRASPYQVPRSARSVVDSRPGDIAPPSSPNFGLQVASPSRTPPRIAIRDLLNDSMEDASNLYDGWFSSEKR